MARSGNGFASVSRIGLLGGVVTLVAGLGLSWLNSAANPLALGSKLLARQTRLLALTPDAPYALLPILPAVVALIVSIWGRSARRGWGLWAAGCVGLLSVWATSEALIAAGRGVGSVANVALWGSAVWLSFGGYALILYAGVLLLRGSDVASSRDYALLLAPLLIIVLHGSGIVTSTEPAQNLLLRVFQEEVRAGGLQRRVGEHLWLAGVSSSMSVLVGVALGMWGYRSERVARVSLYVAGIILTLPSLALFAMLMDPFAALASKFPFLRDYGVGGLGPAPAITGLVLYGLLPVIRNTHAGLTSVSAAQVDAAKGMGMTSRQLLWLVLAPRALPVIMAGVRQTVVLLISIATLAQLIGGGGLGYYILMGINRASIAHILTGVVPAVIIAVFVDAALELFTRALTPKGLRLVSGVTV